ncbi:hypothetical protein J4G53_23725 [Serratia ureilytica]|uniref:hypothetical protein n=1 Tax=Serratia ureilytica TaxID=300181 RepID=UPI001AA19F43|nr:hypothetical protein [Serratia ureilytica]MBO1811262.1 hypothetical protein [Serratia ureilytica]
MLMLKNKIKSLFFADRLAPGFAEITIYLMIKCFRFHDIASVFSKLRLVATILGPWLRRYYASGSAQFLAERICGVKVDDFEKKLITHRLMSTYIRFYLKYQGWDNIRRLVISSCSLDSPNAESAVGKLLLHTHTGDYWLSILSCAMQFEGRNCEFIVPIYQEITSENKKMYEKISVPGMKVTFINIHSKGALLKINRAMKDPHSVIAVFFDLSCYIAGVFNGSVNPHVIFKKNGYITLGMLSLARKYGIAVNFVSSEYSISNGVFRVKISDAYLKEHHSILESEAINFFERNLERNPWQWHFMSYIDTYYHYPFSDLQRFNNSVRFQYESLNRKYLKGGSN